MVNVLAKDGAPNGVLEFIRGLCGFGFLGGAAWRIISAFILCSQEDGELGVMILVTIGIFILGILFGIFIIGGFVGGLFLSIFILFVYCERKLSQLN